MRKICINLSLFILLLLSCSVKLDTFYPYNDNINSIAHRTSILTIPKKLPGAEIRILSDDDWSDYSFTGFGTLNDPYLIENLVIDTEKRHGIFIQDTSMYFIIRNCSISADFYGIYIDQAETGRVSIVNSTIHDNTVGIYIFLSRFSTINDNLFKFNGDGVFLFACDFSSLNNNIFLYTEDEFMFIYYSPSCKIENNVFLFNFEYGHLHSGFLTIQDSQGCLVSSNSFFGGSIYIAASDLTASTGVAITDNEFVNGGLYFSNYMFEYLDSLIIRNNIVNGKELGFFVNLYNKTISQNSYGQLILVDCDFLTVYNQTLSSTSSGLILSNCRNIQILSSKCTDNIGPSIHIITSESIHISNTNISYNQGLGIELRQSSNCLIENSDIYNNNYHGIEVYRSNNCSIRNNDFYKNDRYCVHITFSQNNYIYNNNFTENNLEHSSQGYDDSKKNKWYNPETKEGNFWSDLGENCTYLLDGDSGVRDLYPLNRPLTCWDPKLKTTLILTIPISSLISFYVIYYLTRYFKKKKL